MREEIYKKGEGFMKNNLKKLLCAALSTAMIAGSIVLPMTASAAEYTPLVEGDNVLKE